MPVAVTPQLAGLILYLVLQLGIGIWVARRIRTEDDYLVAGRRLGPALAAFSIFATWFGAETVVGASGAIYTDGLSGGSADPFGYGLALVVTALVFAVPLWRRRMVTLGDLFRERYSVGVERLVVLLLVPPSVIWAAAQIRAFGQVVSATSALNVEAAIVLSAAFVILYTLLGGLMADAITDLVQGIALTLGLVLIVWVVSVQVGGFGEGLALVEPERFRPLGSGGRSPLEVVEQWAVPVCGSVLAIELVTRILACRSGGVARWGTLGGAGLYVLVGLLPVYLGLVGPELAPGLEEPEQVVPLLASRHLSALPYVIFAGALVSIILSTVDSALLAAGGLVSHNVVGRVFSLGDRGRLLAARASVVVLGMAAFQLALAGGTIYGLVETATAFGSAGVFVVGVFALLTPIGGTPSAYVALVLGFVVWAWGETVGGWPAPYVTAVAAAAVGYLGVAGAGVAFPALNRAPSRRGPSASRARGGGSDAATRAGGSA